VTSDWEGPETLSPGLSRYPSRSGKTAPADFAGPATGFIRARISLGVQSDPAGWRIGVGECG